MPGSPLGDRGEALAVEFLELGGWEILRRNFRAGRKEIDLVARRGEVVAFVEVKTRTGVAFGHPLEAITARKRREISEVANAWVQQFGAAGDVYRFDAMAIVVSPDSAPHIDHVENAWGI